MRCRTMILCCLNTSQVMLPSEMGTSPQFTFYDFRISSCVLISQLIPQPRCLSTDILLHESSGIHILLFSYFSTSVWSHQGATCLCYRKPQTHHCLLKLTSNSSPIGSFRYSIQIHFIPNQQRLCVGTEPGHCCWNHMLKWLGYISTVCFGLSKVCGGIVPARQRSAWCLSVTVCLHLLWALWKPQACFALCVWWFSNIKFIQNFPDYLMHRKGIVELNCNCMWRPEDVWIFGW